MANNAYINFIFNAAEAEKQLNEFKSKLEDTAGAIGHSFKAALGATESLKFIGRNVKGFYDEILDTALFAERWKLPIEEVSKFSNAIEMMGGSSEEARSLLGGLQNALVDLQANGGGALKDVSARLALAIQSWDGSFKTSIDLIAALRDEFDELNQVGQEDALKRLGLNSQTLMRYMRLSASEFEELNRRAAENGVITAESAAGVMKLNDAVLRLKNSFKGFQVRMFEENQTGAIQVLIKLFNWLADTSDTTKGAILGTLTALLSADAAFAVIGYSVKSFVSILKLAFAAVKLLTVGFNPWVLGIMAVGAALAWLYGKSETFKAFVDNCIEYGKEFVSGFIKGIWDALVWLVKKIPLVGDDIAEELKGIEDSFTDKEITANVKQTPIEKASNPRNNFIEPEPYEPWYDEVNDEYIYPISVPEELREYNRRAIHTSSNDKSVNNYDQKQITVNVYTNDFDNGRRLGADIRSGIAQQQSSGVRMGG